MPADHHGRVGRSEHRCTGQQVIGGGGQGVLVGAPVECGPHQLFGGGIVHRPQRHIGVGQPADFGGVAGNSEVGQ